MDGSVPPLQIAHLVLAGIVIAVCIELILRCLFVPLGSQKSWLIRILKIIMAVFMTIKSAIFSAFSSDSLQGRCKLAGRIAGAAYHISCLAGLCILLLRVKAVMPRKYQKIMTIFHCSVLIVRLGLTIGDVVVTRIWVDPITGICRYKDMHEMGIAYTMMDTVMDIYVSTVITVILVSHIKKLHALGVRSNVSLYISLVLTNVIRTTILSILNLVCTVYFIVANENVITVLILWPVNNMFFVALIGYDTDIAKSIKELQLLLLNSSMPGSRRQSHCNNTRERRTSLTTMLSEPMTFVNQNNGACNKTMAQNQTCPRGPPSDFVAKGEEDITMDDSLSKVPENTSEEESERSTSFTVLNMTTQEDNMTNSHLSCRSA